MKRVLGVFSNSAPLTVGAMFILSGALIRTGVIDKVGNYVVDRAKRNPRLAVIEVFGGGLLVSGFINSTPFVVVMMPVCFRLAEALGVSPKKLLMPLSVIAVLGGCLTLIGVDQSRRCRDRRTGRARPFRTVQHYALWPCGRGGRRRRAPDHGALPTVGLSAHRRKGGRGGTALS